VLFPVERRAEDGWSFSPLYPVLYPGADFQSQTLSIGEKAETNKTIVTIERIIDCISWLKMTKSAFWGFQSSALPTELPSQPQLNIQASSGKMARRKVSPMGTDCCSTHSRIFQNGLAPGQLISIM
jgi:hypothetical protein